MFGKVKDFLGIEGVKMVIIIPEEINSGVTAIQGKVHFMSMRPQTITGLKLRLVRRATHFMKDHSATLESRCLNRPWYQGDFKEISS